MANMDGYSLTHKVTSPSLQNTGLYNTMEVHKLLHTTRIPENIWAYTYLNTHEHVVHFLHLHWGVQTAATR